MLVLLTVLTVLSILVLQTVLTVLFILVSLTVLTVFCIAYRVSSHDTTYRGYSHDTAFRNDGLYTAHTVSTVSIRACSGLRPFGPGCLGIPETSAASLGLPAARGRRLDCRPLPALSCIV